MAGENSIVIPVIEPPATDLAWRRASETVRLQFYKHAADIALSLKQKEIRRGIGVDGEPLAPVQRASRPDGATGPPLSPHYAESRTRKWLRASIGVKAGTVTLWWSHGWATILSYHRAGLVIGAPIRDVIGLTAVDETKLQAEMRAYWRRIKGGGTPPATARVPTAPRTPTLPTPQRRIAAKHPAIAPYLVKPPAPRADLRLKPAPSVPLPIAPSKARVSADKDARKAVKAVVGRSLTMTEMATLAGATDDAKLLVTAYPGGVRLVWEGPTANAERRLTIGPDGRPEIENLHVKVRKAEQGKGIGSEIFGRQVDQAVKIGASRIRTFAVRDDLLGDVGYSVWPKMGYDAFLNGEQRDMLPKSLAGARTISDLMKSKRGREWWKTNGNSTDMEFDLKPGSLSRKAWDSYRKRKAKVTPPTSPKPS